MGPVLTFGQRQQALRGLPFYGKGDFNFVASKSNFSGGISIKVLPLSDLSRPQSVDIDDFDREIKHLSQTFKPGSRMSGIKVNSPFKGKKGEGESLIGKFESFKIDKPNQIIRAFIRDPKTMKPVEVYPETLTRLVESKSHLAKTFLEFVI
jgi:hypothetical protein